jgi:hypothetical protein
MGRFTDMFDRGYGSRESFGDKDDGEEFEVTVVRTSPKAMLVRFADESERWIPLSQIAEDSTVREQGDKGTLIISSWLSAKLVEENEDGGGRPVDQLVSIAGCVCLKETNAALMVRVPGREEPLWFPKSHIRDGEVQHDGDVGTLKVTAWIAEQKGVATDGQMTLDEAAHRTPDAARRPAPKGKPVTRVRRAQDDLFDDGPVPSDGDDDIPW